MNILFTLCGRAGSKGFKNKNLKKICGIPLVYYSIAAIKLYQEVAGEECNIKAVLNTDSGELIHQIRVQKKIPINVIVREAALGGDSVPKVAVIRDCLNKMESGNSIKFDMVVDLDLTSPLRTLVDLRKVIEQKAKRPDVDVVYTVTESRRNPYFNMVKREGDFFEKAFQSKYTARQQAPEFYDMNASVYAYSTNALKNKKTDVFFNDRCDAVLMKDTGILDIDSEEDFELMQVIAEYLFKNVSIYQPIYGMAKAIMNSARED